MRDQLARPMRQVRVEQRSGDAVVVVRRDRDGVRARGFRDPREAARVVQCGAALDVELRGVEFAQHRKVASDARAMKPMRL